VPPASTYIPQVLEDNILFSFLVFFSISPPPEGFILFLHQFSFPLSFVSWDFKGNLVLVTMKWETLTMSSACLALQHVSAGARAHTHTHTHTCTQDL
jgi:hypothetical protein